jgi:hypothetical protein
MAKYIIEIKDIENCYNCSLRKDLKCSLDNDLVVVFNDCGFVVHPNCPLVKVKE